MSNKYCKYCDNNKPIIDFTNEKRTKDGKSNICRSCTNIKSSSYKKTDLGKQKIKLYLEKNKEKTKEYALVYYEQNKEDILKRTKGYYSNNPEKFKEYQKEYRTNNLEKVIIRNKIYKEKNKEKFKILDSEYREKNKEKLKNNSKKWREENELEIKKKKQLEHKNNCDNLTDFYVKNLLIRIGFDRNLITPELIKLKRITLKTTRLCRQLKN